MHPMGKQSPATQVGAPLPWPTTRFCQWSSCEARAPTPRYFYCLGTRLRKGVAWSFFFFSFPLLYLAKSRKMQGMAYVLEQHDGLCSADGSVRFTEPQSRCSSSSFPPKLLFFTCPDGVENECIWFPWSRRWGNPRGAPGGPTLPGSPQEGAAAGSLKTGWCVTASGFLAHAGKPRICYGTIHQEGEGKQ